MKSVFIIENNTGTKFYNGSSYVNFVNDINGAKHWSELRYAKSTRTRIIKYVKKTIDTHSKYHPNSNLANLVNILNEMSSSNIVEYTLVRKGPIS